MTRTGQNGNSVFECQKCGQCCDGHGGIVLSPADLERLADFLGATINEMLDKWVTVSNGKRKIKSGMDGRCVFFSTEAGCSVHPAKPDVCRAWPFFRGNLEDPVSFALAREYCPGIAPQCAFDEFAQAGARFYQESGIVVEGVSAHALQVAHILRNRASSGQG